MLFKKENQHQFNSAATQLCAESGEDSKAHVGHLKRLAAQGWQALSDKEKANYDTRATDLATKHASELGTDIIK